MDKSMDCIYSVLIRLHIDMDEFRHTATLLD